MRKKPITSLYQEVLQSSQKDLQRTAAMEALGRLKNLNVTLDQFIADLKDDWSVFGALTLADVVAALAKGKNVSKGTRASAGRRKAPPKRLNKALTAKYSEAIIQFLGDHPASSVKSVAAGVGLASKQASLILKKLRGQKLVASEGKAAGMRYSLTSPGPQKPLLRPKDARKASPKSASKKKSAAARAKARRTTSRKK